MSGSKSLSEALLEEMEYLNPIKEFSDFIIDTTDYSPNDLRQELNYMSISEIEKFSILLQSFSYKKGLPRNIDIIFDCRFLKKPILEYRIKGFRWQFSTNTRFCK